MKAKFLYFIVTWGLTHSINAQEKKYPIAEDVESVDGMVSALYTSISQKLFRQQCIAWMNWI